MKDNSRFIVITGGPGSGKGTPIAALSDHGLPGTPKTGRANAQGAAAIPSIVLTSSM